MWICGVRGSTPTPGPDFVRYGGNTSCVAIGHDGAPPTLVLDAGTGIRRLGTVLEGRPFRGSLLFGHLHWDHTQGLPFSAALDGPEAGVAVYMPDQGDPVEVLSRAMSPPHFPILPNELRGDWTFHGLDEGIHEIEGFEVLARQIPHKGGRTFGYRVTSPSGGSIAYLSDHWPISLGPGPDGLGEYHPAVLDLCRGVDLVFHDAQYTTEELPSRKDWGHSAIDYVVGLGQRLDVAVMLYHHDPSRTDDQFDEIAAQYADRTPSVGVAAEGMVIDLP